MPEVSQSNVQQTGFSNLKLQNVCIGCGLLIKDQFIYKVLPDMQWHEECLKCVECDCKLKENSTCFVKNGKAYCKTDYNRLFLVKCNRCGDVIKKNDLVMKSKSKIYHYECFCCNICNKKLLPGDEYQIKDEQLYCKEDALMSYQSTQLYISNLNGFTSSNMPITPENSVSSSFSPSTTSTSSSIIDSPKNMSNFTNNSFNTFSNTLNQYNSFQSYNIDSSQNEFQDKEDDGSISDDDELDNEDDDNDNSISEESLNESVNSMKNKNNKTKNASFKSNTNQKPSFQNNYSSNSLLKVNGNSNGHKPARIRTVLNEKQLHTLRACYGANPRPDALMKEQLVEMTGLNPRVIRVWFQNKRCKDKKKNMLGSGNNSRQESQLQPHHQQIGLNHNSHIPIPTQFNNHQINNIQNQHNLMYDNCY